MKTILILLLLLTTTLASAADLVSLNKLFSENFDNFYRPRFCRNNIGTLIAEASKQKINLRNSYVLKIVGAGFLETSGFYTRGKIDERAMLGYFHFVLVADGYVYDFDLDEPLVLKLEDYTRLQFTPPYLPFKVFGISIEPEKQLPFWTVTRFEIADFNTSRSTATWTKQYNEILDLKKMMKRERVR